jgi:O-antigen/teichoic acid export membrane protein
MWALVMSLVDQYGLLEMGMGPALARFTGYFQGAEERKALDEVFCTSLVFTLLIASCISVITLPAALILPAFFRFTGPNRPTFMWLLLSLGLTTAIAFPERIMASYLRGLQRFDLFNAVSTSAVIIRAVLCVAAILAGYKVLTVAAITLIIGMASCVAHYAMIRIADPLLSVSWANVRRKRLRELFGFSIYVFIASIGARLTSRIDSIVIARILTVALVTPYSIAIRLMDYFAAVFGGVQGPLMSAMSELHGRSQQHELHTLFVKSSKLTFLLSVLLGSLLVFDGNALLTLWLANSGIDLTLTYRVLVLLTCCYITYFAQLPAWTVIYARAQHQLLAWLALFEGTVDVLLSVYWGHKYGLIGVAMGTTVPALVLHLVIVPWYALRVIAFPAGEYFRRSVLRPLVSNMLFVSYCLLTMKSSQTFFELTLRITSQTFVFALLTYFVGFSKSERKLILELATQWFPLKWLPGSQGR